MKMTIAVIVLALISAVGSFASTIPSGSKLFVDTMDGNMSAYVTAEIIKQHLPVVVVTNREQADYILTGQAEGSSQQRDSHNYNNGSLLGAALGGHSNSKTKFDGALLLISIDGTVIWASDAGDRKVKDVAGRIVKQLKHDQFKN